MYKIGDRVGAILSGTDTEIKLLGYGTYEGEDVPPENAGGFGSMLHESKISNPKIKLDNGKFVYGCECWWGTEEKIRNSIKDRTIVIVDIDEARKEQE